MRKTYDFNHGWRFHRGDIQVRNFGAIHAHRYDNMDFMKAGNHGLSKVGYPESPTWAEVTLPHDFALDGTFGPEHPLTHGSLPKDVGWYRKVFDIPAEDLGKRIRIECDGIFRDSSVWINGHFAGRHLSGYTSFALDLTHAINYGEPNCIAIRCDNREPELWSYEGGGIYRDVRLVKTAPVHVAPLGTWARVELPEPAAPEFVTAPGTLTVDTKLINDGDTEQTVTLQIDVHDPAGKSVATMSARVTLAAYTEQQLTTTEKITQPALWSPDHPQQYTLATVVIDGNAELDRTTEQFGIKTCRFDAETGFYLNGRPLKLKGVCNHQDHAGVGIAIPESVERWRIEQMKVMGVNAIRTSHNPPSPQMLRACDDLGVLVMDETRLVGACREQLDQLRDLVVRDRNHPCVFMWSVGNEEMLVQDTVVGVRQMKRMQDLCHQLDPTRAVTYAMNCGWHDISRFHNEQGFRFDVFGGNYVCKKPYHVTGEMYDDFHRDLPDWPLLGSETGGSSSYRGVYRHDARSRALSYWDWAVWSNPDHEGLMSSYGETFTPWGYSIMQTWKDCADRPYMVGTFLWTGFDYRGETSPTQYPAVVTGYGLLDLCGFFKDSAHYYRVHWCEPDAPRMHLFPHWNFDGADGEPIPVWVYANVAKAELFVNGKSQGRRAVPALDHAAWTVPYAPGTIRAVGYDAAGNAVIEQQHETTGRPASLRLTPVTPELAADGRDVAIITVDALDDDGRAVPDAVDDVSFEIAGPGVFLGAGNGDALSHEHDRTPRRRLYAGLAQLLIQASREPGTIEIKASASGLRPATLRLNTTAPAKPRPWVSGYNDQRLAAENAEPTPSEADGTVSNTL